MPRYKKNQGFIIWLVFILLICTLPIWIWLLTIPLKILGFIGEIGVSIFGEGNGAIFIVILMLIFMGFLALFIKILEKKI